ncbi:hypothetical protein SNE40_002386 [Patella caerulea]|uniref:CCHC-type domain-containing protein n=1 Tax=Patella caerulea TaxID=87958 RepID=A0AAN8K874_PATCE
MTTTVNSEANMSRRSQLTDHLHVVDDRDFKKNNVVLIRVPDMRNLKMSEIIDYVEDKCGEGSCYACVPLPPDTVEVTLNNVDNAVKFSQDVNIKGRKYESKLLQDTNIVVSFLNLPSVIEDHIILDKLKSYNIEILGPVVRNYYTNVRAQRCCTGTRHVKCKFPENIKSLPYAMKFETSLGVKSFKVLHNSQVRVCFKCLSPEHVMSECPNIKCHNCKKYGHLQYSCPGIVCVNCDKVEKDCVCTDNNECNVPIVKNDNEFDTTAKNDGEINVTEEKTDEIMVEDNEQNGENDSGEVNKGDVGSEKGSLLFNQMRETSTISHGELMESVSQCLHKQPSTGSTVNYDEDIEESSDSTGHVNSVSIIVPNSTVKTQALVHGSSIQEEEIETDTMTDNYTVVKTNRRGRSANKLSNVLKYGIESHSKIIERKDKRGINKKVVSFSIKELSNK